MKAGGMRLLIYLIVGVVLLVAYIRYLETKVMFVPAKDVFTTPTQAGMEFEDVFFKTSDGVKLHGWFIPSASSTASLLFCHGNAGNIGDRLDKLRIFHELGLNVFIFDYRGYGHSEGRPTEAGMYKDTQAAFNYLSARTRLDKERITLYGESLGGAAAVDLASKEKIAALIVDSSFSNAADMAKVIFPVIPTAMLNVKLDSLNKVRMVRVPSLYFHSIEDEMVPYSLGKKLFDAANEPKVFIDLKGSHNDGHIFSGKIFVSGIKDFLKEARVL